MWIVIRVNNAQTDKTGDKEERPTHRQCDARKNVDSKQVMFGSDDWLV